MVVLIFSEMYDIIYKEAQPKVTAGLHTVFDLCLYGTYRLSMTD